MRDVRLLGKAIIGDVRGEHRVRAEKVRWRLAVTSRVHELRHAICAINRALPAAGLVVMHCGNASGFDPASQRVVIKPSGMDYNRLSPDQMVEIEVSNGQVVGGGLRPSVDLPHHLFLYRNMPEIRGIVHTHSNYATAFAACQKPIPVCLTAMADEFGAEIPCAPYVDNMGEAIGQTLLAHKSRAPAILLGGHGVFAWGPTPEAAFKTAVMVEDAAKTMWLALQIGSPPVLPPQEVEKWHHRYRTQYGQQPTNQERSVNYEFRA